MWSVLAGIALLMALLLLIFGGYLPGQEYFKVSRVDLFDANGVLIDSIKLPGGSVLEWEDTTQFSRMDIYAEWRFVLTDPDPDPPEQLRMVLEVLGEFTDLPAGAWMPPPDAGTGPYGLSLWDHKLTWVSTGKSAGDPDKND